mgnify:CR=1 FL=1
MYTTKYTTVKTDTFDALCTRPTVLTLWKNQEVASELDPTYKGTVQVSGHQGTTVHHYSLADAATEYNKRWDDLHYSYTEQHKAPTHRC